MPETRKKKNKREFDLLDTTMSLGDHLEELRSRIIMAIFGLVIASVLCFIPWFGMRIIRLIEKPYYDVFSKYEARHPKISEQDKSTYFAQAFYNNVLVALASDPNAPKLDPKVVEWFHKRYVDTINSVTRDPNYVGPDRKKNDLLPQNRLVTLAPSDSFTGYMKIAMITAIIISSPWIFYQMWMFVAAGLYAHERRYVQTAVPFSVGLFITGALFFLFIVAPICLRFFLVFGDFIGVAANWTFQKYISFVTMLMLVFGLAFQTPIAIYILTRTGLVPIETLKKARKYVFLSVFVIGALVTPPDIISQVTLAVPLYGLFELGILISQIAAKRRKKKEEDDSETDESEYEGTD